MTDSDKAECWDALMRAAKHPLVHRVEIADDRDNRRFIIRLCVISGEKMYSSEIRILDFSVHAINTNRLLQRAIDSLDNPPPPA